VPNKQIIRFTNLIIPTKLRSEVRIVIESHRSPEYISNFNDDKYTSISLQPLVTLVIVRQTESDENGDRRKAPWNPNDALSMTKVTLPVFVNELIGIQQDLKTPELYTYTGKRLELNEEAAAKVRRVFMVGNMTLELSAVVIVQLDDTRVEGIKMKFNNEQSSVLLTLNEIEALGFNLKNLDIDSISMLMYIHFTTKSGNGNGKSMNQNTFKQNTKVDILPKIESDLKTQDPSDDFPM